MIDQTPEPDFEASAPAAVPDVPQDPAPAPAPTPVPEQPGAALNRAEFADILARRAFASRAAVVRGFLHAIDAAAASGDLGALPQDFLVNEAAEAATALKVISNGVLDAMRCAAQTNAAQFN